MAILFLWAIGEIAFRAVLAIRSKSYPTATTVSHPKMGWTAKSNFTFNGEVVDEAGNPYHIDFSTDENGFKYFGNPKADRQKLLVIGDSYTHAIEVSNIKTYYGVMLDNLPNTEFFVFGARGIGPLQQYLWLEEWLPVIQPDAILWQFCFNDVFNSSYALESTSYFNNNRRPRPYLENGKIVYRNPARLGMGTLREYSKSVDFLLTKVEGILESQEHKNGTASEDLIQKLGKEYAPYSESLENMDAVLKKIKSLTGNTPMLAFQTDVTEPFISDIRTVFESNGIPVVKSAAEEIDRERKLGKHLLAKDLGHWNEEGHAIAADEIWSELKEMLGL